MKFYSSCFSRVEKEKKENVVYVSISLWDKKVWKGYRLRSLNPSESILMEYKNGGSWGRYVERFKKEILDKKDCREMVENLKSYFGEDKDVCFVCYEWSNEKCHRRLVGEWLLENGFEYLGEI